MVFSQLYSSINHVIWCVCYHPATTATCKKITALDTECYSLTQDLLLYFQYFVKGKQLWTARSTGEVDPFKLTLSSNKRNRLLARIMLDLHAMLFAVAK